MVDEDMAKVGMRDVGMPRVGMVEVVILTINSGNSNSLPKKQCRGNVWTPAQVTVLWTRN